MTLFETLYRDYFDRVFAFCLRLCGDTHTAEDITAETFLRAMRGIDSFRGDGDPFVWLCEIAKNRFYTHRRKQARRGVPLDEEILQNLADPAPTPGEMAADAAEAARIRRHVHGLPEPYREVFLWRACGALPFARIGELYGRSENWACVTYHRALKLVKERMEKE